MPSLFTQAVNMLLLLLLPVLGYLSLTVSFINYPSLWGRQRTGERSLRV